MLCWVCCAGCCEAAGNTPICPALWMCKVSTALHRACPPHATPASASPRRLVSPHSAPCLRLPYLPAAENGRRRSHRWPSTCAAQHGVRPQPRRALPSGTPHARLRPAPTSLGRVTPSPCALRLTPRKPAARIGTNSITCCLRCALSLAAGCPRRPRSGYFRCRLRCLGGARLGLVWRMAGTACDAGDSRRG